ncbi:DUF2157 domain-containing protein [soil metagenome]
MSKLESGLKEWTAQGFINDEQARKIQTYESSKTQHSWILSGLLILGAIIVGIGVVSLIASNWSNIPDALKLGLDLVLLLALAGGAVVTDRKDKPIQFEVFLVSLQIIVLASIGLISQIYNTGGKPHQALLLWSFITMGIALVSRQFFVPFVWSGLLMTGLLLATVQSDALRILFDSSSVAVIALSPLMAAVGAAIAIRLGSKNGMARAIRWWILWGVLNMLAVIELSSEFSMRHSYGIAYYLMYGLAAVTALDIALSSEFRRIQKGLLLASLVLFLIACHLPLASATTSLVRGIATIVVLSAAGIFLASAHARGLFQLFVSLIGLRFLVLYFQAFGGLATTGVGLIISGIVVIGMAVVWNKYRTRLAVWAERSTQ